MRSCPSARGPTSGAGVYPCWAGTEPGGATGVRLGGVCISIRGVIAGEVGGTAWYLIRRRRLLKGEWFSSLP